MGHFTIASLMRKPNGHHFIISIQWSSAERPQLLLDTKMQYAKSSIQALVTYNTYIGNELDHHCEYHTSGLVQDCYHSSVLAMESLQSYT